MDKQKTYCFVSGALAVVLHIARFVGAAPLHFVKTRTGWRIRLSTGFIIYGYVFITSSVLAMVFAALAKQFLEKKVDTNVQVTIRHVVNVSNVYVTIIITGTIVFGAPGQMKSMIACLNHIQKINYELDVYHWPKAMEKRKLFLVIFLVILTLGISCSDSILTGMLEIVQLESLIVYMNAVFTIRYIYYVIIQLKHLMFIMLAMHVMYSFRAINNHLRNLIHEMQDFKNIPINNIMLKVNPKYKKSFKNVIYPGAVTQKSDADSNTTKFLHEHIHRLTVAYSALCDVVREVDRCYGRMLFMFLGSFMQDLVTSAFYFFKFTFADTVWTSMGMQIFSIAVQVLWCFYHIINFVMIIEPCHLTHLEMAVTRELVSNLMLCRQAMSAPMVAELDLFFRTLILNQVSYAPMGVTPMTRSLVATIMGTITTYLVIIIQI